MGRLINADVLKRTYTQNCDYENCIYDGAFIVNNIDEQPTIDAPVKRGKWIEKSTGGEPFYRCSECGYVEWDTLYNYCPNCGARMDND